MRGSRQKAYIQSSDIIGALFPSHSKTKKEKQLNGGGGRGVMCSVHFESYT